MANRWDVAQAYPSANALTPLYAVIDNRRAVVSTISACNQSDEETWFSVTVAPLGVADEAKHYLYRQAPLRARRTFQATIGIALAARAVVRVTSGNGRVSFTLSRDEQDA